MPGTTIPRTSAASRSIAALLTGAFMLAEVAGGLVSGSLALLADAGHMLTDFASLALAWTDAAGGGAGDNPEGGPDQRVNDADSHCRQQSLAPRQAGFVLVHE